MFQKMGIINILPQDLVNKIAAGEVIERPASVVKELIENSIDANADSISIEVNEGGKSLIVVTDNGIGMDAEDAALSIKRHATSKISKQDDLYKIKTLGFRGEALASIAAVSKLTIQTRKKDSIKGTFAEVEDSEIKTAKPAGCPAGTKIEVRSLFYNIPARKKYLGTVSYEFSKIFDIATRYALINNNISFKLLHNNKKILFAPKANKISDRIAGIYGKDIAEEMIELRYSTKQFSLDGLISRPSLTRKTKDMQSVYINKRFVKIPEIISYIYEAYHTMLHSDRHPIIILNLTIEPELIDVNVHPTKDIVKIEPLPKFKDEIITTLKISLAEKQEIPKVTLEKVNAKPVHSYAFRQDKQQALILKEQEELYATDKMHHFTGHFDNFDKIGPFIVIGQINKTYILAENKHGLMIIDQHAAQERVNYEKFLKELSQGAIRTQSLIKPRLVELSAQESRVLNENLELLKRTGFTIEDFGNNSFLIRTIPMIFQRFEKNLLTDMINELADIDTNVIDEVKEKRIITMACRSSIKAGDELTISYMEKLINELAMTEQPYTCPHGRPTIINVTIAELERKFRRVC